MKDIFFGFILGIFLYQIKIWLENKVQAKHLASAFYGEIEATLEVALKKENMAFLEKLKADFMKDDFYPFYISFKVEYFQIYRGNISNIGLLKSPNPALISKFYIYSSSILDEFETINTYIENGRKNAELGERVNQLCILFKEAGRIGYRCCEQLNSDYKTRSK